MVKNTFIVAFAFVFAFAGPTQIFAEEIIGDVVIAEESVIEEPTIEEKNPEPSVNSQVTICHYSDEDGFVVITINENGLNGHDGHENDIIPITDQNDDEVIDEDDCRIVANPEDEPTTVTIIADMILCDSEALLPNWGTGGSNIGSTTASNFIASNPDCALTEGRLFQWGDDSMTFGGDEVFGEDAAWTTAPATDGNGRTQFTVDLDTLSAPARIEMRQVLEEGDITFTFTPEGNTNSNNVSAEFYCHTDVLNYDNWDWINNPVAGETYYCVGFNVSPEPEPLVCIEGNLVSNGSFETPTLDTAWDVFSGDETGWNTSWISIQDGKPEDALLEFQLNHLVTAQDGNQYVELDTDWSSLNGEPAGVSISQTLATVPGIEYTIEFYVHARPGTSAVENTLDLIVQHSNESVETLSVQGENSWQKHTFTFTATGEETVISFEYTGTENSLGIFLDNVSVQCGGDSEEEDPIDDEDPISDEDPTDDEDPIDEENPGDDENPTDDEDNNDEEQNPGDDEETTPEEETNDQQSSSTGGSNSSGSRILSNPASQGEVLGATISDSCPEFTLFHKKGDKGGEVAKIQQFLNDHMNAGLTVDGVFGPATEKAVHAFQQKYWEQTIKPWTPELSDKTTGRWYKTTKAWANELLNCRELPQTLEDTGRQYSTEIFVKEEETVSETDSVS